MKHAPFASLATMTLALWFCPRMAGAWAPYYGDIAIFPHLVGIADFIFTGTPISTNGNISAQFMVDEVLWGHSSATNITVKDYSMYDTPPYQLGEKYLVGAFTNDWWMGKRYFFGVNDVLLRFVPATNPPPSNIFLDDYRIVHRTRSAIPFRLFDYGGTNYWEGTRAFITNLIDVGRVQCDERGVREMIESIVNDRSNSRKLPIFVRRQALLYKMKRYDWEDNRSLTLGQPAQ